jgi:methionyl-tRNA formyltransferase
MAGDEETGITIMQMEAGLDTGPMLLKKSCPIGPKDTGGSLHNSLSPLGAEALLEALPGIAAGTLKPEIQNDDLATYASKLAKSEAVIDWTGSADELSRQMRAFNPWPVAQTELNGKVLRIWDAVHLEGRDGETPGKVLSCSREGIDVATGDGVVRITKLQMPGKRAMSASDFLNAHTLDGVILG